MRRSIFLTVLMMIMINVMPVKAEVIIGEQTQAIVTKALELTGNYTKPITGGDEQSARMLYAEYGKIYEETYKYIKEPPKNTWQSEIECVKEVNSIVNMRRQVLLDYIIMVEAYKNNRAEEYKQMITILYEDTYMVNEMRENFYERYGI